MDLKEQFLAQFTSEYTLASYTRDLEVFFAYLNSKNIKTTRGKEFKNSHVYSILKKGFKRHKRLIKKLDMIIENVYIEYPKKKTKFGLKMYF